MTSAVVALFPFFLAQLPLAPPRAFAHEAVRPNHFEDFPQGVRDTYVRVKGAWVSWANYPALKRDFPSLAKLSDAQIDAWIVDQFAYIHEHQLRLQGIRNTEIPHDPNDKKTFYRPQSYNRASVGAVGDQPGLVDLKGNGLGPRIQLEAQLAEYGDAKERHDLERIEALRIKDHSDGLASAGEVYAEVTRTLAAQKAFEIHNARNRKDFQTVEPYFALELPFSIIKKDGQLIPAAVIGRQAHWRGYSNLPIPSEIYTDPHGGKQGTLFGSSVDFGGVLIQVPELRNNFGLLAQDGDPKNPQASKPWAWGHDTALAIRRGEKDALRNHIEQMLAPIESQWRADHAVPQSPSTMIKKYEYAQLKLSSFAGESMSNYFFTNMVLENPATAAAFLGRKTDPHGRRSVSPSVLLSSLTTHPRVRGTPQSGAFLKAFFQEAWATRPSAMKPDSRPYSTELIPQESLSEILRQAPKELGTWLARSTHPSDFTGFMHQTFHPTTVSKVERIRLLRFIAQFLAESRKQSDSVFARAHAALIPYVPELIMREIRQNPERMISRLAQGERIILEGIFEKFPKAESELGSPKAKEFLQKLVEQVLPGKALKQAMVPFEKMNPTLLRTLIREHGDAFLPFVENLYPASWLERWTKRLATEKDFLATQEGTLLLDRLGKLLLERPESPSSTIAIGLLRDFPELFAKFYESHPAKVVTHLKQLEALVLTEFTNAWSKTSASVFPGKAKLALDLHRDILPATVARKERIKWETLPPEYYHAILEHAPRELVTHYLDKSPGVAQTQLLENLIGSDGFERHPNREALFQELERALTRPASAEGAELAQFYARRFKDRFLALLKRDPEGLAQHVASSLSEEVEYDRRLLSMRGPLATDQSPLRTPEGTRFFVRLIQEFLNPSRRAKHPQYWQELVQFRGLLVSQVPKEFFAALVDTAKDPSNHDMFRIILGQIKDTPENQQFLAMVENFALEARFPKNEPMRGLIEKHPSRFVALVHRYPEQAALALKDCETNPTRVALGAMLREHSKTRSPATDRFFLTFKEKILVQSSVTNQKEILELLEPVFPGGTICRTPLQRARDFLLRRR